MCADHVDLCDHLTEVFACVKLNHTGFWIPLNSAPEKIVWIFFNYIERFLKSSMNLSQRVYRRESII